LVSKLRTN